MALRHECFHIRKSADRSLFAAPRSLSQLITSFVGSWCQGIRLMLLFAWTFLSVISRSLGSLRSLELLEFHKTFFRLFPLCSLKTFSFCALISFLPPFGEIVFYPTFYRKTYTNLLIFVLFVCSFFYSSIFFFFYSVFNDQSFSLLCEWLAQVDSNHRPRAYQARALTSWAMRQ